jgi:hypothetical protein
MEHINSLDAFDRLVASGIPETQARAHVRELNSSFDGVATKQDLIRLEKDLTKEISGLRWLILGIGSICALPILERLIKYSFNI